MMSLKPVCRNKSRSASPINTSITELKNLMHVPVSHTNVDMLSLLACSLWHRARTVCLLGCMSNSMSFSPHFMS